MRTVTDVHATPHLGGGRIDLSWTLPSTADFEPGRRLGSIVVVRRERTFPRDSTDGYIVFSGAPVPGISDAPLEVKRTYYYTVYAIEVDEPGALPARPPLVLADQGAQAWSLATSDFGSAEYLYSLLPGVHQVHDVGLTPSELGELAVTDPGLATALAALPPDINGAGPLKRYLAAAAAPLDLMRSTAEALRDLHDVDVVPPEYLPLLANWLGWEIDRTRPVHEQRNEVKFAPRLYRKVGTVESMRRLVTQYTGWYTHAAEMDQALLRSNQPPQLNLYAAAEDAGEWIGVDDASTLLGFGPGNRTASGADGAPPTAATLDGTVAGPFALRPGMELTVTADNRLPSTIRFLPGDFAAIGAATAAEVAAVLNHTFTQQTATVLVTGHLRLTSHTLGATSSLEVTAASASLVSLDGAPRGRLASFVDAAGRVRLVFAAADPLDEVRTASAHAALRGEQPVVGMVPGDDVEPDPARNRAPVVGSTHGSDRVLVKTWAAGQWRAARPLDELPSGPRSDPAAAQIGASVLCSWVEDPGTAASRLRFSIGTPQPARPAVLAGTRSEPFVVEPGMRLVFGGRWPVPEGVELAASEVVPPLDPANLTAVQVVNLLTPHLVHATASVGPRRTIVLSTTATGGDERLQLELSESTGAAALGFGQANASAIGDWGDGLDWSPPADVTGTVPGRYADTFAAAESAAGPVHLFWAAHSASAWRIFTARWNGAAWTAPVQIAAGAAGNREPCAVFAPPSQPQLVWSQLGAGQRWTLRRAVLAGGAWGGEVPLLQPADQPAPATEGDREPSAVMLAGGQLRVFFRSDRGGGMQLWSTTVDLATGVASSPVRLTGGAPHRANPTTVAGPDGRTWLLHRSDANVSLSSVGVDPSPHVSNRVTAPEPVPVPVFGAPHTESSLDLGARRRFAGSTTLHAGDAARFGRRRRWDDHIAYTTQRTVLDPALISDDDLYERGTVGLYLSPTIESNPLTERTIQRLQGALTRFLPAPVRTVVVLTPDIVTEVVYDATHDIGETFFDDYPFADTYTGPVEDAITVALPNWIVFLSAAPPTPPVSFTANPAVLTTLRSRTWFPPPV